MASKRPQFPGATFIVKARNLGVLLLFSACVLTAADQNRVSSISGKVLCDCGCREVLAECSHKVCQRKPALRQEIASAIDLGKSDNQVMAQLAGAHGNEILLTPTFRGFNTLLWIVPVTVGLAAAILTLTVQRRRRNTKAAR